MGFVVCPYCETSVGRGEPFCRLCGGRPREESPTERAISGLMLVSHLIRQRAWFGLEKEIAAAKARLDADDSLYPACEPAILWLVDELPALASEPDVSRSIRVARRVLALARGQVRPEVRAMVGRLGRFAEALRDAHLGWKNGSAPRRRKALSWLAERAEAARMTERDALESVYETPHLWPIVAATLDPEADRRAGWKYELAGAEAEFRRKNFRSARRHFEASLALKPDSSRAHEGLGRAFQALGRTDRSISQFREAVRARDAGPSAWNSLAWLLATEGRGAEADLDEALWAARRAVALAPRSPCWDTLAEVLSRRGDLLEAVAATREAIRLDPDRPSYRVRMRALRDASPPIEERSAPGREGSGSDFELTALDASDEFEATPLSGPGDSDVTAAQPSAPGINLARPSDSGINLQGVGGFGLSQADSIELAPLDEPATPAPKAKPPTSPKLDPNSATVMPGVEPGDPGTTSPGMAEKSIFEDTDFGLEVYSTDSDHDDRTMQIDRSSDFDLEESDSASEVFSLDEVDQDAATAMGAAIAEDESGEFSADVDSGEIASGSGWDVESEATPSSAAAISSSSSRPVPAGPRGRAVARKGSDQDSLPRKARRALGSFLARTRALWKRDRDDAAVGLAAGRDVAPGVEIPRPLTDRVHFSLTAPSTLAPGGSYVLDVWAYLEAQRDAVMALARESQGTDDIRVKTKGGVSVERGAVLAVRVAMPTLEVSDPEDLIVWDGEIGNATFPVAVPAQARTGPHSGTVVFHVEQLPIAKLHFVLEVGQGSTALTTLAARESRCRRAFASYASEDRDEVLGRLQGILKVLPDLDLFLDVVSLRSGERWEERLYQEIARRDTLYLFWSLAASRSPWVEREWRAALALRGISGIDPVPLISPEEVPPPAELAEHLHFNDWLLAFMRGRRGAKAEGPFGS